jgi:hypothetical protein
MSVKNYSVTYLDGRVDQPHDGVRVFAIDKGHRRALAAFRV